MNIGAVAAKLNIFAQRCLIWLLQPVGSSSIELANFLLTGGRLTTVKINQ